MARMFKYGKWKRTKGFSAQCLALNLLCAVIYVEKLNFAKKKSKLQFEGKYEKKSLW